MFHRRSGYSTAYVGSSNLTHSAQVTGMEWNVRASAARNPAVIDKFEAVFDSYWAGGDYVPYDGARYSSTPFRLDPGKGQRVRVLRLATTDDARKVFQVIGRTMIEF